ncbi:MAG: hypothetical protein ABWY65_08815, partial [Thermoleophilaceae bacterium]
GVVRGEPGMYVLGLPFIHTLTSAFTGGVGRDAEYVARQIEARSAIESARQHSVEYAGRAAGGERGEALRAGGVEKVVVVLDCGDDLPRPRAAGTQHLRAGFSARSRRRR